MSHQGRTKRSRSWSPKKMAPEKASPSLKKQPKRLSMLDTKQGTAVPAPSALVQEVGLTPYHNSRQRVHKTTKTTTITSANTLARRQKKDEQPNPPAIQDTSTRHNHPQQRPSMLPLKMKAVPTPLKKCQRKASHSAVAKSVANHRSHSCPTSQVRLPNKEEGQIKINTQMLHPQTDTQRARCPMILQPAVLESHTSQPPLPPPAQGPMQAPCRDGRRENSCWPATWFLSFFRRQVSINLMH